MFAWVSLAFIVTSIFTICLWTVEYFKGFKDVADPLNITKHPATNETQANNSKCLKKYGYFKNRPPVKNKEDEIVISAAAKHNLKTESFLIGQNKHVFRNMFRTT